MVCVICGKLGWLTDYFVDIAVEFLSLPLLSL